MAKQITTYVKLNVAAGAANPSPPVGTALGPHSINIMDFCKAFNAQTQELEKKMPCPVVVTIYSDKSFTFIIKTPPASFLIKKAANVTKGSGTPNKDKIGKLNRQQLEEIATIKMPDLNANDMDMAVRIIAGTARSMGVETEGVK